jgi:hypothetical protein
MKLLVDRRAGDLAVKDRVLRHVLDDLARVPDPLLQELYGKELSRSFALSDAALADAIEGRRLRPGAVRPGGPAAVVEPRERSAVRDAESGLLRLALSGGTWLPRVTDVLEPEDFASEAARRLFEALRVAGAQADTTSGWFDRLGDPEERSLATRLAFEEAPPGDPERLFADYVATLKGARLEAAEVDLRRRLAAAEAQGDADLVARLLEEQRALAQDRSSWKKRAHWS